MTRYVLLEPTTLLGKETHERLSDQLGHNDRLEILTQDEELAGTLTAGASEARLVGLAQRDALVSADVILDCRDSTSGTAEAELEETLQSLAGTQVVRIAGRFDAVTRDNADDELLVDTESQVPLYLEGAISELPDGSVDVPHPAALVGLDLLRFSTQLASPLTRQRLCASQPLSLYGQSALDEALGEAGQALNFRGARSARFAHQVPFNLFSSDLQVFAQRDIEEMGLGQVSLQVLQAPVFHGLSVQVELEFEDGLNEDEVRHAVESTEALELQERPSCQDVAGLDGLLIDENSLTIRQDRYLTFVAYQDNLNRVALEALDIVRALSV